MQVKVTPNDKGRPACRQRARPYQVTGESVTTRSANLGLYNSYCSKEDPRDRQNHRK